MAHEGNVQLRDIINSKVPSKSNDRNSDGAVTWPPVLLNTINKIKRPHSDHGSVRKTAMSLARLGVPTPGKECFSRAVCVCIRCLQAHL